MRAPKGKIYHLRKTGIPLYCYGLWSDITDYKNDNSIIHRIDGLNLAKNYYYPEPEDALLTKREKEILFWLTEGLGAKQIADKLFVTESTVTNHRVNMLKKTNTVNVAQLIAFAIRNRIIWILR